MILVKNLGLSLASSCFVFVLVHSALSFKLGACNFGLHWYMGCLGDCGMVVRIETNAEGFYGLQRVDGSPQYPLKEKDVIGQHHMLSHK